MDRCYFRWPDGSQFDSAPFPVDAWASASVSSYASNRVNVARARIDSWRACVGRLEPFTNVIHVKATGNVFAYLG